MNKEEILKIIDNSVYFTEELSPVRSEIESINKIEAIEDREKAYVQFTVERDVVNRLLTIEECRKWDEGVKSEFYKGLQKKQVTNPKNLHNPMNGIIPYWGIKMTEEEFNLYEEVYDELFELV